MALIIDGYNLLYVAGIAGRGERLGELARSRLGLLWFLVETLDPSERAKTTVVFDARGAPPGLPQTLEYGGMTVRFTSRVQTADELIGELIQAASVPKQLTVVSSDHQVQRSARRRRARAVDSDVWHDEILHRRHERETACPEPSPRPAVPLLPDDVAQWLDQFGGEEQIEKILQEGRTPQNSPQSAADAAERKKRTSRKSRLPEAEPDKIDLPLENPFPPGYAEDLEE